MNSKSNRPFADAIIAEVAYALTQGLYVGELLDRFDTEGARELFVRTMRSVLRDAT